jgi:putative DNA primase/helicase
MNAAFESWVQRARNVPIERELERRGVQLNGGNQIEREGPCPVCGGNDRFSINTKKQVFNCRGCGKGGDVIELVRHLDDADFIAACTTLVGESPPKSNGKDTDKAQTVVVAEFPYHDENGDVVFVVERVEYQNPGGTFVIKDGKRKKSFRQRRPDPGRPNNWIPNTSGVRGVPYRLPQVLEAIANGHSILVAEGEGKCDLLASWNVPATCCAGGAGKWRSAHTEFLRGANVVLVPDADNAGAKHAQEVGASLSGIAKRVRVLLLPGLPPKGDVIDWARAGGTREQLDALIERAPDWQPLKTEAPEQDKDKAKTREDELLGALAKAQGLDYARQLKAAAKELDVDKTEIQKEVQARREKAPLYGHWIVEPWPETVEGDALLRDIIRRIRRHVFCSHEDALPVALWIMLSWVHDAVATHSPLLVITSAEPMSGKTTMLAVLSFLVPRSIRSVEITEAALYRSIELWHPTLVCDEFDSVLASDDKTALRSVINSGHTRGDGVLRINRDKNNEPELFPTFGAKCVGMVGRKLPPQTLTRCIFVELRRRKKNETVERFKYADDGELNDLRRRLLRWSLDNEDKLADVQPLIPAELENRYDDNWRLQLAIADLAGEDWGDQARAAAIRLERAADNTTASARLLATIQKIRSATEVSDDDAIGSQQLIDKLTATPDSEWAEWRHGKPISEAQLARLLKPFRIFPEQVRVGGQQVRGYHWLQFKDAWERYA